MSVDDKGALTSEEELSLSPDELHLAQLGYKQEVSMSDDC